MATTKIKGSAIDIANSTDGSGITVSSGNDKLLIYDADASANKYITVSQLPSATGALTPSTISGSAQGFNILSTALFTSGGVALKTTGSITVGTTISGAGAISGQSLTIGNKAIISQAGVIANATTISGASTVSAAALVINGVTVATQAGALVAPTTVSGAGVLTGQNLTVATTVSGAGAISCASLTTEDATISVAGALSGASGVSAALLTINGTAVATQAGALVAPTTVSGAGVLTGQNLTVATTVSGAGALQGQSLTIGNKSIISQAGVIANATTISGASVIAGHGLTYGHGIISSSAGGGVIGGTLLLTKGTTTPSAVALKVSGGVQIGGALSASFWTGLTSSAGGGGVTHIIGEGILIEKYVQYFNSVYSDGPPSIQAFQSSSAGGALKQYSTASLVDDDGGVRPMSSVSGTIADISVYKNGLLQRSGGLNSSTADYYFADSAGGQPKIHFQYSASSSDYIIIKFNRGRF